MFRLSVFIAINWNSKGNKDYHGLKEFEQKKKTEACMHNISMLLVHFDSSKQLCCSPKDCL